MAHTASRRGRGRLGRLVTGLAAAALLLALIAGLPYLLVVLAGNPFAGIGDLLSALSTPDNGELFLRVLAIVGWLAWASFALSTLVEIPAQLRGRRTVRIPGLSLQQKVAAALIAAIAAVIITPGISAAVVSPAAAAPPTAHARTTDSDHVAPATVDPPAGGHTFREHQVSRGESLLGLAEHYGVSLTTLAEANYGLPQPDGAVLQPGQTRIYAGWTLRIPEPAGNHTTGSPVRAAPRAAATSQVYVVERGDWLYHIAARFLGDGDRYPEVAALNPHLEADDVRFPDHIEQTWRITLPPDAYDRGPRAHATGHVLTPDPAPGSSRQDTREQGRSDHGGDTGPGPKSAVTAAPTTPPTTNPTSPPTTAPATTPPATTAPATTPSATAPAAVPDTPAATTPVTPGIGGPGTGDTTGSATAATAPTPADSGDDVDVEQAVVISTALAGAGLLSALILRAVTRRRRHQQAHRGHRRRLPNPGHGATERRLRVAEQPADVDRLDAALRHLAAALADREPDRLPDIRAVWINGGAIQAILAGPCPDPPPPWTDNGSQWLLPPTAHLPEPGRPVAPLPTLVAVGSQPGRHLLIDLERAGAITIDGDHDQSIALLRYIASELACNSWSDDVEIILAGFPPAEAELLVALSPDRVRVTTDIGDTIDRLRRRSAATRATLHHNGVPDTFAARVGDIGDVWPPQVLLIADRAQTTASSLAELVDDGTHSGRTAVAVVAIGDNTGGHRLRIDADGTLQVHLGDLSTTAVAAGLPSDELAPLAEIMTTARATIDEPTPPAGETEPWADGTDAAGGLLHLFGPTRDDTTPAAADPIGQDTTDGAGQQVPPQSGDSITSIPSPRAAIPPDLDAAEHRGPATVPAVAAPPRREISAAIRQRRRQTDPHLDRDLQAWRDKDPTRPRISILGPVAIEAPGTTPEHRRRFTAEIVVFLAQRGARGADRHLVEDAIWPDHGVKDASVRVAITRARRWLGETPDRLPWIPDMGSDRIYRITDGYQLDWHLFRRLRARGEAHGNAGVKDLHAALDLVRGIPLDGADRAYASGARNPYTWLPESDIYPPHLVSAIADTAHQLADIYLDIGDTAAARWAVQQAWRADPDRSDDALWLDLMRAEHVDGHHANLRTLLADLLTARDAEVPEDLNPSTYAGLITYLPDVLQPSTVG